MRGGKYFAFLLCIVLCVIFLSACGEQAAEDPALTQPTTEATQPQGLPENNVEEEELPAVTIPQQTQPVTEGVGQTEPGLETKPTEPSKESQPPEVSQPSQPTTEAEPTEPETPPSETVPTEPETTPSETVPTEPETTLPETVPTEPPKLDEDELPPVPLF